jgi:hypothetical protein
MSPQASRSAKRKGRDGQVKADSITGTWMKGNRGRRILIIAAIAVICGAVIFIAMLGNTSVAKLQISKGDQLQYSISGYESGDAVSGALTIEVTKTGSNSFTAIYSITIGDVTNRTELDFDGTSGGWSSNVDEVVGRLSGSGSTATVGNTSTYSTLFGTKELTAYTISATSQLGKSILFQYWLDTTTRCPYLLSMTYGNGDVLTFTLVGTNIGAFE